MQLWVTATRTNLLLANFPSSVSATPFFPRPYSAVGSGYIPSSNSSTPLPWSFRQATSRSLNGLKLYVLPSNSQLSASICSSRQARIAIRGMLRGREKTRGGPNLSPVLVTWCRRTCMRSSGLSGSTSACSITSTLFRSRSRTTASSPLLGTRPASSTTSVMKLRSLPRRKLRRKQPLRCGRKACTRQSSCASSSSRSCSARSTRSCMGSLSRSDWSRQCNVTSRSRFRSYAFKAEWPYRITLSTRTRSARRSQSCASEVGLAFLLALYFSTMLSGDLMASLLISAKRISRSSRAVRRRLSSISMLSLLAWLRKTTATLSSSYTYSCSTLDGPSPASYTTATRSWFREGEAAGRRSESPAASLTSPCLRSSRKQVESGQAVASRERSSPRRLSFLMVRHSAKANFGEALGSQTLTTTRNSSFSASIGAKKTVGSGMSLKRSLTVPVERSRMLTTASRSRTVQRMQRQPVFSPSLSPSPSSPSQSSTRMFLGTISILSSPPSSPATASPLPWHSRPSMSRHRRSGMSQMDCFLSFFSSSRESFMRVCSTSHSGSLLSSAVSWWEWWLLRQTSMQAVALFWTCRWATRNCLLSNYTTSVPPPKLQSNACARSTYYTRSSLKRNHWPYNRMKTQQCPDDA